MVGSIARRDTSVKFSHSQERECLNQARRMMRMEQTNDSEFAEKVLQAIREDGRVKTAILDLVCACPNVVTEY